MYIINIKENTYYNMFKSKTTKKYVEKFMPFLPSNACLMSFI